MGERTALGPDRRQSTYRPTPIERHRLTAVQKLAEAKTLLDMPLTCLKCDETFANTPTLKRHLEEDWKRMKRDKLRRIRETGRQSSDEGYL
jgi:hypothetical protein